MLYAEARPVIASGDLLAFANPRFVSRLIRTWTGGSWSHVGIAWRYKDRVFVLAAREGRRRRPAGAVPHAVALVAAMLERGAEIREIMAEPARLAA